MRRFATLYAELDRTTSTLAKREAIAGYLIEAPPAEGGAAGRGPGVGKETRMAR
jgi:DNA ligase-1